MESRGGGKEGGLSRHNQSLKFLLPHAEEARKVRSGGLVPDIPFPQQQNAPAEGGIPPPAPARWHAKTLPLLSISAAFACKI